MSEGLKFSLSVSEKAHKGQNNSDCPAMNSNKSAPSAGDLEGAVGVSKNAGMTENHRTQDSVYLICRKRSGQCGLSVMNPCGSLLIKRVRPGG